MLIFYICINTCQSKKFVVLYNIIKLNENERKYYEYIEKLIGNLQQNLNKLLHFNLNFHTFVKNTILC